MIATASDDGTVAIWNSATGQQIASLRGHTDGVQSIAFSKDGTHLLSGSKDHTARLWNIRKKFCVSVIRGHDSIIQHVSFTPDEKELVTVSIDKTIRFWPYHSNAIQLIRLGERTVKKLNPLTQAELTRFHLTE